MLLPGEQSAINSVLNLGGKYGYGNMIAHLKTAWAKKLMAQGIPKEAALQATNVSAYPISENEPCVQGGRANQCCGANQTFGKFYCSSCGKPAA